MKRMLLLVLPALICACSSPRYSYYFDRYDYSEGRKVAAVKETNSSIDIPLNDHALMADVSGRIVLEEPKTIAPSLPEVTQTELKEKNTEAAKIESFSKLSRKERRELIRDLKQTIRQTKKNSQLDVAPDEIHAMDQDLKMAIIFGAVGLTLSLFTGINAVFGVLGIIAIVVGVVFLVRWLIRQ